MGFMARFDNGLIRVLQAGGGELPPDFALLGDCLHTLGILLAEKATELEPSWSDALAVAAEIETLLALEAAVAERAIAIPATTTAELRAKVAIWRALGEGEAEADPDSACGRLLLSIDADLARL